MRLRAGELTSSPTDLANFLACRHKTMLDVLAAQGRIARPTWTDPLAAVLRDRGIEHERQYVERLRADGRHVVDLGRAPGAERVSDVMAVQDTVAAMRAGADVIVQAPLFGDGWFGYADVLRRVEGASALGGWHYEVHDTKLTRETRGGTLLQLCVYTDLVAALQQRAPDRFRVVTPAGAETYRPGDFSALYRRVRREYRAFVADRLADQSQEAVYPQPTGHCDVCRWAQRCQARRRRDDHLSFVAGLGRVQQTELEARAVPTLAALAAIPLPLAFRPTRGAKATYERLREQARVQEEQRDRQQPVYELFAADGPDFGLLRLPAPSAGDLFLDFEGDPFARDGGREYLVGLGRLDVEGRFRYEARWAFTDEEERSAFEWLIDELMRTWAADPGAHVYHYAPYEPAAVKRLMARYAAREVDVDRLLRGARFVDLYAVVRQSLRAGVESYSNKKMEPFYGFVRELALERAGDERRLVELALETGDLSAITAGVKAAVEAYNRDDCRSTEALRGWLESLRTGVVLRGIDLPRPPAVDGEAHDTVAGRQRQIEELRARLLARAGQDTTRPESHAARLLAFLLDWHYREDKVAWWEYFRLAGLPDEDLFDEPAAVAGLEFVETLGPFIGEQTGKPTSSIIQRFRFPPQEFDIRPGVKLKARQDEPFGQVLEADRRGWTIDVKRGRKQADRFPSSAFAHEHVSIEVPAAAIGRIAEYVASRGFDRSRYAAALSLLLREPPRPGGRPLADVRIAGEAASTLAVRLACQLDETVLPIQGPPGAGKTSTGARMICELVRAGRRVGITATGHRVIRHLLEAVGRAADEQGLPVRLGHKCDQDDGGRIAAFADNEPARAALAAGEVDVVGGTAWMWARPEFAGSVDVLFVDEAGQISLANALAVSHAASSLVLLGDPQQLEQPQKGSHPDGVGVSALQHVLGSHMTMPDDRGLFLAETWRLSPAICEFTSSVFYEGRLSARPGNEAQGIGGSASFSGSGLRIMEVPHEGCRNASDEEVDAVEAIAGDLLGGGVTWTDDRGVVRTLTARDILVVAPYNAHVGRLHARLGARGIAVGTVDKFQGQEAPVVIYSMATSRPEDAPRGMSFLYNLNRLNVATSRARCLCILVASPRLFEPDCQTPSDMRLANGLCRYREMAAPPRTAGRPASEPAARTSP
jgi:uncharacterized protein